MPPDMLDARLGSAALRVSEPLDRLPGHLTRRQSRSGAWSNSDLRFAHPLAALPEPSRLRLQSERALWLTRVAVMPGAILRSVRKVLAYQQTTAPGLGEG
jgi:hypothetical protein